MISRNPPHVQQSMRVEHVGPISDFGGFSCHDRIQNYESGAFREKISKGIIVLKENEVKKHGVPSIFTDL